MGKRAANSNNAIEVKDRSERDWYATPEHAVVPLIPHLPEYFTYCEPCAGDLSLCSHLDVLTDAGAWCEYAYDIHPRHPLVTQRNCLTIDNLDVDLFITNPPFKWTMLESILKHLPTVKPTWLLLPLDYLANKRMSPYMKVCRKVVAVGRVKWFPDSKTSSTDNFAWYLFDSDYTGTTKIYGRT